MFTRGWSSPLKFSEAMDKIAIKAHRKTNCLTEVMMAEAERWTENINLNAPLAGIPVSLKDTVIAAGFDASVGYSSKTYKPATHDGALVRFLRDAGEASLCFQKALVLMNTS